VEAGAFYNLSGGLSISLGESHSAVLRFSEGRDAFVLDFVLVPSQFRGQGIGRMLIERLLRLADALQKAVQLTARPIGRSTPESVERLVRYYETFGFVVTQRGVSSAAMYRPPGLSGRPSTTGGGGEPGGAPCR